MQEEKEMQSTLGVYCGEEWMRKARRRRRRREKGEAGKGGEAARSRQARSCCRYVTTVAKHSPGRYISKSNA